MLLPTTAGTEPLVLCNIKCCNFAHHSSIHHFFKTSLVLYRTMVSIISFVTNEVWVFVVSLWNAGVTVCLHTKKLNLASGLHLHVGMYFPLVEHNGFAVQGGFFFVVVCGLMVWGLFVFLTKWSVVLSISGCCIILSSSSKVSYHFLCSLWRTSALWEYTKAQCFQCLTWAFFSPKAGTEAVWKRFLSI